MHLFDSFDRSAHRERVSLLVRVLHRFIHDELHIIHDAIVDAIDHDVAVHSVQSRILERCMHLLFNTSAGQVMQDYRIFLTALSSYGDQERSLRSFLSRIVQSDEAMRSFLIDPSRVEHAIASGLERYFSSLSSRERVAIEKLIDERFGGDHHRFLSVLLFFVAMLLISASSWDRLRVKGRLDARRIHDVFAHLTLGSAQYARLVEIGAVGGIVYRGLSLDPSSAKHMLSERFFDAGSAWSSSYDVAVRFASQGNDPHAVARVLRGQAGSRRIGEVDSLKGRQEYFLVDDPKQGVVLIDHVMRSRDQARRELSRFFVEFARIHHDAKILTMRGKKGVIACVLGVDLSDQPLHIFLGDHAVGTSFNADNREVVFPKRIRITPSSVDCVVPVQGVDAYAVPIGERFLAKVLARSGIAGPQLSSILRESRDLLSCMHAMRSVGVPEERRKRIVREIYAKLV